MLGNRPVCDVLFRHSVIILKFKALKNYTLDDCVDRARVVGRIGCHMCIAPPLVR